MQSSRLGEILVKNNLITKEQLAKALEEQKLSGGQLRLGTILIKQNILKEQDLTSFLSKQYGVPTINLADYEIDAAINAGIPVITIDSDAPQSKRLFFIGTNNYQAGVIGGQLAAKKLGGRGSVVVFTMPGQKNLDERLDGYRSAFANTQIKLAEVIDIQGNPMVAFEKAREVLGKHKGQIDGYICLEALGGKEVADVLDRQKLKNKTLIAMDTDDETLEWIRKDMIVATIAQKPFTMAYYGLKMLDDLHHNKPNLQDATLLHGPFARFPAFVDTGATLVDKSNLDEFIRIRDEAAGKGQAQPR